MQSLQQKKYCSEGAKNQMKSMFGRMLSTKMAIDKTEISDLHFEVVDWVK